MKKRVEKMKKIITVVSILLAMIFLILGSIYCIKYFFWEPSVPYSSKYDEQYVTSSEDGVYLISQDILQLQNEILEYARQYKSIDSLSSMKVVLNSDYEITGFDMDFNLDDVDNYWGIMQVCCTKEASQWMVYKADSYYYEKEEFSNTKCLELCDDSLVNKTDAVTEFIKQNITEKMKRYIIEFRSNEVWVRGIKDEDDGAYNLRLLINDDGVVETKTK